MLTAHGRAFVSVLFRDRDGNGRSTSLSFPFSLPISDLQTAMAMFTTRAGAISDAYIAKWEVTHTFEDYGSSTASINSDVLRRMVLYYRNGEEFDRIWIPSARSELFEVEGPYADVRLDVLNPDVIAALESMQSVVSFIVTPENEAFPTEFVVGGLAL